MPAEPLGCARHSRSLWTNGHPCGYHTNVPRRDDTKTGPRGVVEEDAPARSHHGTPSELVDQVTSKLATVASEHLVDRLAEALPQVLQSMNGAVDALRKRESSWPLVIGIVSVVTVLTIGVVSWGVLTHTSECNPLVVEHVMHQADVGSKTAERMRAAGHPEIADAIKELTDPNTQPDNVRLCVLIEAKKK